ncbi:MAG: hypothetical protein ACPGYF_04510 [Chitinophagales bacterium]
MQKQPLLTLPALFKTVSAFLLFAVHLHGATLLIPMDEDQNDHLKAYGITYWALAQGYTGDWLLNYRGGSFAFPDNQSLQLECRIRGVDFEVVSTASYDNLLREIASPSVNAEKVKLEKAPRVAVYSPKSKKPWDDAVTLVLTYAEIPYDVLYDDEILDERLLLYDWLHLHHEDFTGQYGRFYASYRNQAWYKEEVAEMEASAHKHGHGKVSQLKLAVVKKISAFMAGGGYMFAMCSATDSYDIALAAQNTDICETMFDGDPMAPNAQSQLDFSKTLAFKDFNLRTNPMEYEYSDIDANFQRQVPQEVDYFSLFNFSAKWDPIPTMLTQCHTRIVKGFMGQTTAFRKSRLKSNVTILAENDAFGEARYIHGKFGLGMWSWYGGHDPEDYRHYVGDPVTELKNHPNSPGYRLILNNVLFPAAEKKEQKT